MLRVFENRLGILITILFWIMGFLLIFDYNLLFIINYNTLILPELTKPVISYFNDFIEILFNNLTVALIISLGGYLTFGLISGTICK